MTKAKRCLLSYLKEHPELNDMKVSECIDELSIIIHNHGTTQVRNTVEKLTTQYFEEELEFPY